MSIQWYPGHMHKASKQIKALLPKVDLIIELLDARIPYSSENPMIATLRSDKPTIKVMNKCDLADAAITAQWRQYFETERNVKALALTTTKPGEFQQLIDLCKSMLPNRDKKPESINAMILGIPNVGKSTTINILSQRPVAKTGNEPAITKGQQRIRLNEDIVLWDTPGLLWPKVENPKSGYRLATTGAIKNTAIDYTDIAFFAVEYMAARYPQQLQTRYELDSLPDTELALLEAIGAKRGCLRSGAQVDLNKVSEIFLDELRNGMLGPVSFETPEMVEEEKIEVARLLEENAEKMAAKKKKKRRR